MVLNCEVGEDSWESLGLPGHPRGNQPWIFTGRTDVEAETPILWPLYLKSWLIWKDPDAGKDWGQEEKGTTEDEMAGWHHWIDGHGFGWTPGVGDRQRALACCSSWGRKESGHDWVTELNWTELTEALSLYNWPRCFFCLHWQSFLRSNPVGCQMQTRVGLSNSAFREVRSVGMTWARWHST